MNNPKPFQKRIAIVLLAIFLPSLLPTNLLFASNGGPTSPEASSFEPVDALDMVNLFTGDMSYVLPVLNVPSPEGGYPLSLSYHAGIAMDQEASWVGLGWNLNPGAINRAVNGTPDDWYQTKTNQIIYNAGGEAKSYSGSISVGWGGKGGYSVGLYASYSENKTFGGTTSYNFDGGATGSVGPLGGNLGSDGVGVGIQFGGNEANKTGFGLGVNQSFKNGSTSMSLDYGGSMRGQTGVGGASTGVSWSSQYGYSASVGSQSMSLSKNKYSSNVMSVNSQSYSGSIQIYAVNIGFGYSKTRYWSYQREYTKHDGSLYSGDVSNLVNDLFPTNVAYDSYNSLFKLNGDAQLEGDNLSYVSYDNYSVSGQGISGTFKPAIFENGSLINNYVGKTNNNSVILFKNGNNNSFTKSVDDSTNDIHFYFDNENSSFLKTTSDAWSTSNVNNTPVLNLSPMNQTLETSTIIDGELMSGYNSSNKRKRTGSVIETFTNSEIISNPSVIVQPNNYNRTTAPAKGVGAFKITALDGKTYHYSIPVYQKEQFAKNTDLDSDFNLNYLEFQQLQPYATHWLITAITGPDYFDTNQNNKVDESDYGYWVEFDYGKWSDGFSWSTPIKYMDKTKVYEWGVKELYYLDKIKTRTHSAVFVKSVREDNQSYSMKIGNNENDLAWENTTARSFVQDKNGGYHIRGVYENHYFPVMNPANTFVEGKHGRYMELKNHKSLKLDKILLFKNQDLTPLNLTKQIGNQGSNFFGKIKYKEHFDVWYTTGQHLGSRDYETNSSWGGEFYNNVFDVNDFNPGIDAVAIKSVSFDYASSGLLAKNSPNSSAPNNGKLTLKAVNFIGKNNTQLLPPYKFDYINNLNYNALEEDNWGYLKNNPEMWSLDRISTPTGADINIVYESDDIDKEAVPGFRGFDSELQFQFYSHNDKVRILVQNEYLTNKIDFLNHFQVGNSVTMDVWASLKHDYNDWGCKSRKGSVDINSSSVQVVSVTNNALLLEYTNSAIYSDNGGFGWMSNKVIGLKNHPNMIRENFSRGQWGEPPGCTGGPTDRLVLVYSILGNKKDLLANERNGGGIRVKELSIKENNVVKKKTKYFYNVPGYGENKLDTNYMSSGITSFVPQKYFKEIKYRSELPSPMVMYEYVTVKNCSPTNEVSDIVQYNFQVLEPDTSNQSDLLVMGNTLEISKNQGSQILNINTNSETYNLYLSKYSIFDRTSSIGRLKGKKAQNGIGHVLSSITNDYSYISGYSGQGISGESFSTYKRIGNNGNISYRLGVTSKLVYPSHLKSSTTNQGGVSNTIYYDKYDFLTGQVIETRNFSSDGHVYKTKSIPAYVKYPEMGSKSDDLNNQNMLLQNAATYSYIQDAGIWKQTGVGLTTWNNEWVYQDIGGSTSSPTNSKEKVWRKHKSYTWNGVTDANGIFDSSYNSATDDGFNWTVGVGTSQPSQWKQVSEVTQYSHYSMPLEIKDINGNKASTKMDVDDTKVIATGSAAYNELYYSGAETNSGGGFWVGQEVRNANGIISSEKAHTGKYSIKATDATQFGAYMRNGHRPGKYKLSVWVHKDNAVNARVRGTQYGTPTPFNGSSYPAGDWILMTHTFDVVAGDFYPYVCSANSSEVYFDDLMIRPIASSITGYVYNEFDELTHIIGNNGLATRFEYDAAGRLVKTYVEVIDDVANGITGGFKLQSENKINYKNLN